MNTNHTTPAGKKIRFEDDFVEVYNAEGKLVESGILDESEYKYEDYRWNEKDQNYDLPYGYKMVCR